MKQVKPCPKCGRRAGWTEYVDITEKVARDEDGDEVERTLHDSGSAKDFECGNCGAPLKQGVLV